MDVKRITYYYTAGLWNKQMVKVAVRKGVITKKEYTQITGEEYN